MKSNRGGIREGAGRKPNSNQSVVVRVPVDLLPIIEEAKLGLPPKINLHLATDAELVKELEHRGFEVSIYVEPTLPTKAERNKRLKIQAQTILNSKLRDMGMF